MDKQIFEKILPNIYTPPPTTLPNQSTDMDYNNGKVTEPALKATLNKQTGNNAMKHTNQHIDLTADTNTLGSTPGNMNTNVPLPHPTSFESKDLSTIIDKTTAM